MPDETQTNYKTLKDKIAFSGHLDVHLSSTLGSQCRLPTKIRDPGCIVEKFILISKGSNLLGPTVNTPTLCSWSAPCQFHLPTSRDWKTPAAITTTGRLLRLFRALGLQSGIRALMELTTHREELLQSFLDVARAVNGEERSCQRVDRLRQTVTVVTVPWKQNDAFTQRQAGHSVLGAHKFFLNLQSGTFWRLLSAQKSLVTNMRCGVFIEVSCVCSKLTTLRSLQLATNLQAPPCRQTFHYEPVSE